MKRFLPHPMHDLGNLGHPLPKDGVSEVEYQDGCRVVTDNPFSFDFGDVVDTICIEVESPRAEPGTPHPAEPHEFHKVKYREMGVDPDFVACRCGQMAALSKVSATA